MKLKLSDRIGPETNVEQLKVTCCVLSGATILQLPEGEFTCCLGRFKKIAIEIETFHSQAPAQLVLLAGQHKLFRCSLSDLQFLRLLPIQLGIYYPCVYLKYCNTH